MNSNNFQGAQGQPQRGHIPQQQTTQASQMQPASSHQYVSMQMMQQGHVPTQVTYPGQQQQRQQQQQQQQQPQVWQQPLTQQPYVGMGATGMMGHAALHSTTTTTTTTTTKSHRNGQPSSMIQPQQIIPSPAYQQGAALLQPTPIRPPTLTSAAFNALEQLKVQPPPAPTVNQTATATQTTTQLSAYDQRVNDPLKDSVASGVCPMAYRWYPSKYGYNCGGGNHVVSKSVVEALLQGPRPFGPDVELVNQIGPPIPTMQPDGSCQFRYTAFPGIRCVTPPATGWEDPLHWDPAKRVLNNMNILPKKASGECYSVKEISDAYGLQRRLGQEMMWGMGDGGRARRLAEYARDWADPRYQW